MRCKWYSSALLACGTILFLSAGISAHEADQAGSSTHRQLTTVVAKIQSGLIFLQPAGGIQHRAISLKKAERMGIRDAQVGDKVTLMLDESNVHVLLDIHTTGVTLAGHSIITGKLRYADPFWGVVELTTAEGTKTFAVDSSAGRKFSVLNAGKFVRGKLDEDNMLVDVHPIHAGYEHSAGRR